MNEGVFRRIFDKIVGMIDYGNWQDSAQLFDYMVDGVTLSEKDIKTFTETGHIELTTTGNLSSQELICKCMRVTSQVINQCISEHATFQEISDRTGAGTICGACKPTILDMLGAKVWTPCYIKKIITHKDHIKSFQFQPIDHHITSFFPGQYVVIKVKINDVWIQRNYTLTSTPHDHYYEITVKKEEKGIFSSWLFEHAKENIILYVAGPYGQFTLESAKNRPLVCFMGGIGITPAIAFLRFLAKENKQQRILIDYSVKETNQFILMEEFSSLMKKFPNLYINFRVTRISGSLTEKEIESITASIPECHIYVCGPKGLEKLVENTLKKLNFENERIHVEQFIHAGSPENEEKLISLE